MRIIDLITKDRILLGASAADKQDAIEKMVELQAKSRKPERQRSL